MTAPISSDCAACTGRGWLLLFNADSAALELQRCDLCCRFDSDEEARQRVASSGPALVTVLFDFCGSLFGEADRAVSDKKRTATGTTRVLRTIRDSLRNAMALKSEGQGVASADPHLRERHIAHTHEGERS